MPSHVTARDARDTAAPTPSIRHPTLLIVAKRVGWVQRQIRRLLIVHGQLTTVELARSIHARPTKPRHCYSVRRTAPKFAVEVSRRRAAGAPIVWKLRE
jgi:hypothetical protein